MEPFKFERISYLLLIGMLALVAWLSYSVGYRYLLKNEQTRLSKELSLFSADLETEIEKFSFLPNVLSRNKKFQELVKNKHDQKLAEQVNSDLTYINKASNTEAIYLLHHDGTTIASSNWETEGSFIGSNFSFRPYFKNVIAGNEGRYFALGTSSKLRGYYFSASMKGPANKPNGAIVVKVNIDQLEQAWNQYETIYLITDSNAVVFSSNKPNWRFRTLKPLSAASISEIARNQQYPTEDLKLTQFTEIKNHPELVEVNIHDKPHSLLRAEQFISALKWRIYALIPVASIHKLALSYALLATLIAFLSSTMLYFAFAWRRNLHEKLEIKQRSARQLREAHDKLEQRVINRTQALSKNNQVLEQEIIDRRAAEKELREAQQELIHSTKLASIGQLASGISHELNQPLAAITSYAENAKKFIELNKVEQTDANLEEILKLSERMKNIITLLKTFSRKSVDTPSDTDMNKCINNALSLIKPRLRSSNTRLSIDLLKDSIVTANPIRLEQVLTNLISNALDAMERVENKTITISQSQQDSWLITQIIDSGPGIEQAHLAHVFDAFYTTKSVGVGLGLGLSISSEIIQSFGGTLIAANHITQGAQFTLKLKLAS